ncbi:Anaerobic dehydrogenase, typically selenocysteine-containing protein [Enhygromyxa salina]|uniref:Anaerobic dehydrogenase, typically selenocysteine-containing protein n=2 Tax=Enhygromyxa salina TaxID=215803 RepID=A0A0C1ZV55_9BACT|nr:Anaerobic dehydrogenase, typically selenocysteine-containing protein [Enhygromyxa salina]
MRVVTGACPHDCPDTCAWQVAVDPQTGRAVDIWGHAEHPFTAGKLCGKVDNYLERSYHADRLTTPLRRIGPKGQGRFQPISWAEAISEIATRTNELVEREGAESILQYSYAGTMGLLQGEGMAQRFFNKLGATRLGRTICASAGTQGMRYTLGRSVAPDPLDFEHARLIWLWGTNTLTSNMHLWPIIQRASKAGAKVVVIDPVRTRTARAADEWVPIRPGTDGALALGLMHVLIRDDLVDHDYVARGAIGFEQLCERAHEWSLDRVEAITGIPAARVEALARDYGRIKPAAIRINYGLQRHRGGGMAVRNIACLPALVGAWRERGGGVQLSSSGSFRLDLSGIERPDLLGDRKPRTFNMNRLGEALSLDPEQRRRAHLRECPNDQAPIDAGEPVHALFVYNCNPAAVAPDQGAVLRGLARDDLFTVVLEHFATDTVDWADIVLPATTQIEHWDIVRPYGHLYLGLNRPAIDPVGQSLPNSEIFRRIAQACGFDEPCFHEPDEAILAAFVDAQRDPTMATISWARLLEQGYCRLDVPDPYLPFADGEFPTPSGRCELYSQSMGDAGYDPLPTYLAPAVSAEQAQNGEILHCISPPAHSFLNSTFVNVHKFARREKQPFLLLHPDDASERGIADGTQVSVENQRGSVRLSARVTEEVVRGTVVAPGIWWAKLSPEGRNINWLSPPDETDMGAGARFFDVPVYVRACVTEVCVTEG